jgi:phosphatidylglycerophosphatase A
MPTTVGQHAAVFIATGGYVGYFREAPGTAGSVLGIALSWLLSRWSLHVQVGLLLSLFILGVVTASCAERWFGTKDHRAIVIDEIVGMVLALLALPFRIGYVIAAFALFRALDIFKPLPVLEHLPGGWGVMCDDLVAAIITNVVLQGVRIVLP